MPFLKENTAPIFEVLPGTELIFTMNGNLLKKAYEAEIAEAASVPENTFGISLSRDVLEADFGPDTEMSRRRLSTAEIDEIKRHIKRLRKITNPTLAIIILVSFAMIMGASSCESLAKWFAEYKFSIIMGLSFWVFFIGSYIRNFFYSMRFSQDHSLGWVIILRSQKSDKAIEGKKEILPGSFVIWTEDGIPCGWRMVKADHQSKIPAV